MQHSPTGELSAGAGSPPGRTARRLTRRAVPGAALVAALAAVALPSAAQAGTATFSNGTLIYSDSSSRLQSNTVTMRSVNGKVVISDSSGVATATPQCKIVNGDLECNAPSLVHVVLGAGDDTLRYRLPQGGVVQLGAGNDRIHGGIRESAGRVIDPVNYFGQDGYDVMDYNEATAGVSVNTHDALANDGRPGIDRENVLGFELLFGSNHRDTLLGSSGPEGIAGGLERDFIAGGGGNDAFYSATRDGADDYHGGPGTDSILYIGRTEPVNVTLDNIANDGATDGRFTVEGDLVRSNVEDVYGGDGDDTLKSFSVFSRLDGGPGTDTLDGGDGSDTLIGGAGADSLIAGAGNDVVDSRDDNPDFVDCGTEADSLSRDTGEGVVRGCETVQVGVLRLADKTIAARAGTPARVDLSWQHPKGWRNLRTVTLRLVDGQQAVGEVEIRPRGERVTAKGFARVDRAGTRLTRHGKAVSAQLALRIDPAMAGKNLAVEVEATDTRGRRQLERSAGTIRVAR